MATLARLTRLAVCGVAIVTVAAHGQTPAAVQMPEREQALVAIVDNARKQFHGGHSATPARDARLTLQIGVTAFLKTDAMIKDWVGTVSSRGTADDGESWLAVELPDGIEVSTWRTKLEDSQDFTMIRPGGPNYEAVNSVAIGQRVVFSGQFVKPMLAGDEEMLERPQFILQFNDLHPAR
jgi:hypothetical protein